MSLRGGPTRNLEFQLTLFQPGRADYARGITACSPGFENLMTFLRHSMLRQDLSKKWKARELKRIFFSSIISIVWNPTNFLEWYENFWKKKFSKNVKGRLSYHLWVECFSQLSFDSEVYTKSEKSADFVYTSESNESCEK